MLGWLKLLRSIRGPLFTLVLGVFLVFLGIVAGGAGRTIAGVTLIVFSLFLLARRWPLTAR